MKPTKDELEQFIRQMTRSEYEAIQRQVEQREVLLYGGILALLAAFL